MNGDSIDAPLIDVQHVSYIYPSQKTRKGEIQPAPALQDVSLQVHAGEYVALLGHNGVANQRWRATATLCSYQQAAAFSLKDAIAATRHNNALFATLSA